MSRLNRNVHSWPGRDGRAIPGVGGGRRVVADPDGDRSARRKHARQTGAGPAPRRGLSADVVIIDDPVRPEPSRDELDCARILGAQFDGVTDDSAALSLLKEMRFDVVTEGPSVTCTVTHMPSGIAATATGEGAVRTRAAAMHQVRDKLIAYWSERVASLYPTTPAVNVADHGAVGDGVADDTAAIQAAIDAAAGRDGASA